MRRGAILISVAVAMLACKPEPGSGEVGLASEPTLVVERQGEALACDLVGQDEATYEIREHADWLDFWMNRELDSEGEPPPADALEARARACAMTEEFSDSLGCTAERRQVLAIPVDAQVSILIVEDHAEGLRSIELSRWMQVCRCSCASRVELLGRAPLRVLVAEYESLASEVHAEADEIVEGCGDDDECMTACLGESYGRQRVLVFDDSLGLQASFFDDSVRPGPDGEFEVRFALDQGRLVANGDCTQVLTE